VRIALVRRSQLSIGGGMHALRLPESRATASLSTYDTASNRNRPRPHEATAAAAAAAAIEGGNTTATATTGSWGASAHVLGRASGIVRRSMGCTSGFDNNRAAAGRRLNPTARSPAPVLLHSDGGRDERRRGRGCSPRNTGAWRWGEQRAVSLQVAGLRTTASAYGPPAGGQTPSSSGAGSGSTGDGPGSSPPQVTPADGKPATTAADQGATIKGGNPALRDGRFSQMRDRIRQGRLDASEDAKDWMRDKRDDMNTMKEVRR